jgi:hypothetical protein
VVNHGDLTGVVDVVPEGLRRPRRAEAKTKPEIDAKPFAGVDLFENALCPLTATSSTAPDPYLRPMGGAE